MSPIKDYYLSQSVHLKLRLQKTSQNTEPYPVPMRPRVWSIPAWVVVSPPCAPAVLASLVFPEDARCSVVRLLPTCCGLFWTLPCRWAPTMLHFMQVLPPKGLPWPHHTLCHSPALYPASISLASSPSDITLGNNFLVSCPFSTLHAGSVSAGTSRGAR